MAHRFQSAAMRSTPAGTTPTVPEFNSTAGSSGQMTPNIANKVKQGKQFLSTLLRLAREHPEVAIHVQMLTQGLIDAGIEPEEFTSKLQRLLNSPSQPSLIPLLKISLPYLRDLLATKEVTIEGIIPPPVSTATVSQPSVIQHSTINDVVEVVDISGEKNESTQIKCFCDQKSNGLTVICGQCEDWFHCACVGISEPMRICLERKEAEWFCPRCNQQESPIKHRAKLFQLVKTITQDFPPAINHSSFLPREAHMSSAQEEESKCCKAELAKLSQDIKAAQKPLLETRLILKSRATKADILRTNIAKLESKNRAELIKKNLFLNNLERLKQQQTELTRNIDQLEQELNNLKEPPTEKKIKLENSSSNASADLSAIQLKETFLSDVKVHLSLIVDERNDLMTRMRGVDEELAENDRSLTRMRVELDFLAGSSPSSIVAQWRTLKKEQQNRIAKFCRLEKKLFQISCDYVFDEIQRKEEEWMSGIGDSDDD